MNTFGLISLIGVVVFFSTFGVLFLILGFMGMRAHKEVGKSFGDLFTGAISVAVGLLFLIGYFIYANSTLFFSTPVFVLITGLTALVLFFKRKQTV